MPVGGKRPGAGRKPGAAWKGSKPRSEAMRTAARSTVLKIIQGENDPLTVLCSICADETVDIPLRIQAGHAVAPFLFPRLSAAVIATAPLTAKEDTALLIERLSARFGKMLLPSVEPIDGEAS